MAAYGSEGIVLHCFDDVRHDAAFPNLLIGQNGGVWPSIRPSSIIRFLWDELDGFVVGKNQGTDPAACFQQLQADVEKACGTGQQINTIVYDSIHSLY